MLLCRHCIDIVLHCTIQVHSELFIGYEGKGGCGFGVCIVKLSGSCSRVLYNTRKNKISNIGGRAGYPLQYNYIPFGEKEIFIQP